MHSACGGRLVVSCYSSLWFKKFIPPVWTQNRGKMSDHKFLRVTGWSVVQRSGRESCKLITSWRFSPFPLNNSTAVWFVHLVQSDLILALFGPTTVTTCWKQCVVKWNLNSFSTQSEWVECVTTPTPINMHYLTIKAQFSANLHPDWWILATLPWLYDVCDLYYIIKWHGWAKKRREKEGYDQTTTRTQKTKTDQKTEKWLRCNYF